MKNLWRVIVIFTATVLFSCGRSDSRREYLRLRLVDDPATLDPAYIVDVPAGTLAARLFTGLVGFDHDGTIVPAAAEEWSVSKDGLTYRFRLRPGMKFHNGREVEAADFV